MICFFNKYKKSVQKHTDFFDNSFFNAVPDKPLATRNKSHNNQLCADLFHFISAYPVVSHFLRFAWQTTEGDCTLLTRMNNSTRFQSTPSQRGRQPFCCIATFSSVFQSTHSQRGCYLTSRIRIFDMQNTK